jgi:hypothetical protein
VKWTVSVFLRSVAADLRTFRLLLGRGRRLMDLSICLRGVAASKRTWSVCYAARGRWQTDIVCLLCGSSPLANRLVYLLCGTGVVAASKWTVSLCFAARVSLRWALVTNPA